MVTVSRSRQALSPLPQNHLLTRAVEAHAPEGSRTRHKSSSLTKPNPTSRVYVDLSSSSVAQQDHSMQPSRDRASLKRKKTAPRHPPAVIIVSPRMSREKPNSSASDRSDWSSLASSSSHSISTTGEPEKRNSARSSSRRTSLQSSMNGMMLQDRTPPRLSQKAPITRSRRTASGEFLAGSDSDSNAESEEDIIAEHERLLTLAPTWQLQRLKKDELIQLNVVCTLEDGPSEVALESLTKQDLVNNIISGRSRLDRISSSPIQSLSGTSALTPRIRQGADRDDDFSDESNEGGGEETEAEHCRVSHRKAVRTSHRRPTSSGQTSTSGDLEPVKAAVQRRTPVKERADRFGSAVRRLRRAEGSLSASSSTFGDGGRTSQASVAATRNRFVVGSPIKTRSRSRIALGNNKSRGLLYPSILLDATTERPDVFLTPKMTRGRARRAQKIVNFKSFTPARLRPDIEEDDEWMEDVSQPGFSRSSSYESADSNTKYDADDGSGDDSDCELKAPRSRPSHHSRGSVRAAEIPETDEMEESTDDEQITPVKFRKLRNGKVRTTPLANPEDVQIESDPEGAGSNDEQLAETSMKDPTTATLSRLRKSQLEQLCDSRHLGIGSDDKKIDLVRKLLSWHAEQHDKESDGSDSDFSTATATARAPKTAKAGHSSIDSNVPLMLQGARVHSHKLPTPPLTSNNEEANAPHTGDGVDELNGLDLESLNLVDKEIPPSKLEKLEKIGSGGFKDVYVGNYRISKTRVTKVAIADIRDQLTEMDIKELSLLRDLRHENIVRFIGVSIPEHPRHVPCMIVSELCSNGDLFDYIRNTTAPSDAEVFRILLEIARGLEYLHTRTPSITHRDCKSTNVLITRGRTAKINDFGLARVKNSSRSMMKSLVGTVNWQAVELWVPKPHYSEKVDVWSAAMTFWETLQWHQTSKKYPFQGMNEHQIYQDVGQKQKRPATVAIRRQFGPEIVDLLDRMWDQIPKSRPSMTQVCKELEDLIKMKKAAAKSKH